MDRKNKEEIVCYKIEIIELKEEIKKWEKWMEENKIKYEKEMVNFKEVIVKMKEEFEEKNL